MNSRTGRQLAYFKQRLGNAWWMLRRGQLREFIAALAGEAGMRLWGRAGEPERERALAAAFSDWHDPCSHCPPSVRPTANGAPVSYPAAALPALEAELTSVQRESRGAAGRSG